MGFDSFAKRCFTNGDDRVRVATEFFDQRTTGRPIQDGFVQSQVGKQAPQIGVQFTFGNFSAGFAPQYQPMQFAQLGVLLVELAVLDQPTDFGDGQSGLRVTLVGLAVISELNRTKLGNRFAVNQVGSHAQAAGDLQQSAMVDAGRFADDADLRNEEVELAGLVHDLVPAFCECHGCCCDTLR